MNMPLQQLIQPIIDFYDNGIYYPNLFLFSLLLFCFLLSAIVIKSVIWLPKLITAFSLLVNKLYFTIKKKKKLKYPSFIIKSLKFVYKYIKKVNKFLDE